MAFSRKVTVTLPQSWHELAPGINSSGRDGKGRQHGTGYRALATYVFWSGLLERDRFFFKSKDFELWCACLNLDTERLRKPILEAMEGTEMDSDLKDFLYGCQTEGLFTSYKASEYLGISYNSFRKRADRRRIRGRKIAGRRAFSKNELEAIKQVLPVGVRKKRAKESRLWP